MVALTWMSMQSTTTERFLRYSTVITTTISKGSRYDTTYDDSCNGLEIVMRLAYAGSGLS